MTGSLAFAECDEAYYVNVRTEPSTDSGEVIGILKNHDSAIIESVEDDGWYKIKSGDVEGYVAAWLIKTGDEAAAIAPTVAYNYAVNNAVSLNVRSQADEGSDVVASLDEGAEAEIVADEETGSRLPWIPTPTVMFPRIMSRRRPIIRRQKPSMR